MNLVLRELPKRGLTFSTMGCVKFNSERVRPLFGYPLSDGTCTTHLWLDPCGLATKGVDLSSLSAPCRWERDSIANRSSHSAFFPRPAFRSPSASEKRGTPTIAGAGGPLLAIESLAHRHRVGGAKKCFPILCLKSTPFELVSQVNEF